MKLVLPPDIRNFFTDSAALDYQLAGAENGSLELPAWAQDLSISEGCRLLCEVSGLNLDLRRVQLAILDENVDSDPYSLTRLDELLSRLVVGVVIRALSTATDEVPEDIGIQGIFKGVSVNISMGTVKRGDVKMMQELLDEESRDSDRVPGNATVDLESGQFQVAWERILPYREKAFGKDGVPVAKVTNTICNAIIATIPLSLKVFVSRKKGKLDPTPVFLLILAKSLRMYFLREQV